MCAGNMMNRKSGPLPGTLGLLILKVLSLDSHHGYGVLLRIQEISRDAINVPQGSLYPALNQLEAEGLIGSQWAKSANGRRAKYYRLTRAGRRQLKVEAARWEQIAETMAAALRASPAATPTATVGAPPAASSRL